MLKLKVWSVKTWLKSVCLFIFQWESLNAGPLHMQGKCFSCGKKCLYWFAQGLNQLHTYLNAIRISFSHILLRSCNIYCKSLTATSMHMHEGTSEGSKALRDSPLEVSELSLSQQISMSNVPQLGMNFMTTSSLHAKILSDFIFSRSCACSQSHWKFLGVPVLFTDSIFHCSHQLLLAHTICLSSFIVAPPSLNPQPGASPYVWQLCSLVSLQFS